MSLCHQTGLILNLEYYPNHITEQCYLATYPELIRVTGVRVNENRVSVFDTFHVLADIRMLQCTVPVALRKQPLNCIIVHRWRGDCSATGRCG